MTTLLRLGRCHGEDEENGDGGGAACCCGMKQASAMEVEWNDGLPSAMELMAMVPGVLPRILSPLLLLGSSPLLCFSFFIFFSLLLDLGYEGVGMGYVVRLWCLGLV